MSNAATMDKMTRRIEGVSSWVEKNHVNFAFLASALVVVAMCVPGTAFAQDIIGAKGDTALAWIKKAVYFILVVAVMGAGVAAAFGRMEWATVGRILIGCIVAGLAVEVVGALYGNG